MHESRTVIGRRKQSGKGFIGFVCFVLDQSGVPNDFYAGNVLTSGTGLLPRGAPFVTLDRVLTCVTKGAPRGKSPVPDVILQIG